jgi:hypothetical protein
MTRKKLAGIFAIVAFVAVAWAGGEPWKSKPYTQWDQKDVMTVLQTSPWAKVNLPISGAWHPADSQATNLSNVGVAGSTSDTSKLAAGPGTIEPGSATEKQLEAQAATQSYNVFWWSARTIREASARRAVLTGKVTEDAAAKMVATPVDSYEILVNSPNMAIFQHRGEQAFMDTAFIQLHKSKQKLSPSKVEFQKDSSGKVVGAVFEFPKKTPSGEPTISPDEKEIDFNLQIAGSWLRTYFSPKQMVDSQGEDL